MTGRQIPRDVFIVSLLAPIALLAWGLAAGLRAPPPRSGDGCLVVESPPHVALGLLDRGQPKKLRIAVRNTCADDLEVERVWTSCGCTVVSAVPPSIPAHQVVEFEFRLDTEHPGMRDSKIFVQPKDRSSVQIGEVEFGVRSGWAVTADPWTVRVDRDDTVRTDVPLELTADEDFDVKDVTVETSCPGLGFRTVAHGRTLQVRPVVDRQRLPLGRFRAGLVVKSPLRNAPSMTIGVSVENLSRPAAVVPDVLVSEIDSSGRSASVDARATIDGVAVAPSAVHALAEDVTAALRSGAGAIVLTFRDPVTSSRRVALWMETARGPVGADVFVAGGAR